MSGNIGRAGPLLVAVIAIIYILATQPVSGDIYGFPGNLFAVGVVAISGAFVTLGR